MYIRWIKPNDLYVNTNGILVDSNECLSSARGSGTWRSLKWARLSFYDILCKPGEWYWRVRQGTWEGRSVPVISSTLYVSLPQLPFPNWRMRIMTGPNGQYLLYFFLVYRLDFVLKIHSWLNFSPWERKRGPPSQCVCAVVLRRRWFHRRDTEWQRGRSRHSVREASSPVGRLGNGDKREADSKSSVFGVERSSFTGTRTVGLWAKYWLNWMKPG